MDALTTAARHGTSVGWSDPWRAPRFRATTAPATSFAAGIPGRCCTCCRTPRAWRASCTCDALGDRAGDEPTLIDGKVISISTPGVAPRVYPQYFHFGQNDRKDNRGRAMKLPDRQAATPRVLESGGGFAFGGPALPIDRIVQLESAEVQQFSALVTDRSGLALPTPSDEEDER